jgi:hypothetical protein
MIATATSASDVAHGPVRRRKKMESDSPNISAAIIIGVTLAFALVFTLSVGLFACSLENHPNHMTQNEQNACIQRIEKKLDILLQRSDWELERNK